jgi:hypothetical protein
VKNKQMRERTGLKGGHRKGASYRNLTNLARIGLIIGWLAFQMTASAATAVSGTNSLNDAYAKHLWETKRIRDIRTILKSGDGPNVIDIGVVSAGFTAGQMGEFHKACEQLAKGLFSQPPWNRYRQLFNVHAVFVEDESVDVTRVKVQGYKGNILSCDNPVAVEYARTAAYARITVVIHNSTFSTSSCGYWGVLTLHKGAVVQPFTAMHEVAHGFAGLGDEYIQRNTTFDPKTESLKDSVNVTEIENPRLSRWHYWTEETWPGLFDPLKRPPGMVIENAEGAGWVRGAFRPQKNCVMRGNTPPYCLVCNETLEANFFRYVDLFKSVEPLAEEQVLWKGETMVFRVTAMDMLRQPPPWLKSRLELYMNGTRVGCSTNGEVSYQLRSETLAPGIYQLGANLNVQCDTIRRDFGFLSRSRGWRLTILPDARPQALVKPQVSVGAGKVLDPAEAIQRKAGPSLIFGPHIQESVERLEKLRQSPIVYQRLFETLRLLRDRFDPVHQKALQEAKRLYPELDTQMKNTCLEELQLQAWTFANNPDILKWMREIAAGTQSRQAAALWERLEQIDSYNIRRIKLATEEDLRKQEERRAALLGVVTTWQMSGLYREEKKGPKELVASVFAPEEGPAPDAGWVTANTYSDGILDLRNELAKAKVKGPYDDCAVYLRATLDVPVATEARIELGSDDGLKAWLNNSEVLARPVIRPLLPIQDKVDIQLKQGVNILLLKITQGGGDFNAYARIRNKEGKGLSDLKISLLK